MLVARLSLLPLLLLVGGLACAGGASGPAPVPSTPADVTSPSATPAEAPATASPTTRTPSAVWTPPPGPPLAIINGTLVDGTGAAPLSDAVVLVRDRRIELVEEGLESVETPEGYDVIDAGGGFIIPGLIDGHVHVSRTVLKIELPSLASRLDEEALLPFLQAGFTTLRDVGTATIVVEPLRLQVDSMTARGLAPTVVWAGPLITAPGGYPISVPRYAAGGQEIDSAQDGEALVDRLADNGARLIKLGLDKGYYADEGWPPLSLEEVRAITRRAHERGMLVTAHVTSLDEVRLAIDGGVDNLAHTPLEPLPDELMAEMVAEGVGMVTTATIWGRGQEIAADNAVRYAEAGGIVSVGTDYGCCEQVPGIEPYLLEMQFLRARGMTPTQLIVAATRNGALLANRGAETGTVEPGKLADIVIVDGDPLADLSALRQVQTVIREGHVVFER